MNTHFAYSGNFEAIFEVHDKVKVKPNGEFSQYFLFIFKCFKMIVSHIINEKPVWRIIALKPWEEDTANFFSKFGYAPKNQLKAQNCMETGHACVKKYSFRYMWPLIELILLKYPTQHFVLQTYLRRHIIKAAMANHIKNTCIMSQTADSRC